MATFIGAIDIMETDYLLDEVFGKRLLISHKADKNELSSNIRAARAILSSYSEVCIRINAHTYSIGHKNPEYTICNDLGDRKGIMSEKGVTSESFCTIQVYIQKKRRLHIRIEIEHKIETLRP